MAGLIRGVREAYRRASQYNRSRKSGDDPATAKAKAAGTKELELKDRALGDIESEYRDRREDLNKMIKNQEEERQRYAAAKSDIEDYMKDPEGYRKQRANVAKESIDDRIQSAHKIVARFENLDRGVVYKDRLAKHDEIQLELAKRYGIDPKKVPTEHVVRKEGEGKLKTAAAISAFMGANRAGLDILITNQARTRAIGQTEKMWKTGTRDLDVLIRGSAWIDTKSAEQVATAMHVQKMAGGLDKLPEKERLRQKQVFEAADPELVSLFKRHPEMAKSLADEAARSTVGTPSLLDFTRDELGYTPDPAQKRARAEERLSRTGRSARPGLLGRAVDLIE